MFIVFVCVSSFASALLILDHNQALVNNEYSEFTDSKFDTKLFDSLMTQYLLGLGEFETDAYSSNKYAVYLWLMFLIATILTQIILFNALIAILGDTYARIMEQRDLYGIIQRTSIYADFTHMITPFTWIDQKYVYIARPASDQGDDQWNGILHKITNRLNKNHSELKGMIVKQRASLQHIKKNMIAEIQDSNNNLQQFVKKEVKEMK